MLRSYTYWASFSDIPYLQFSSFKFLNVFLPAETVILGSSWVVFWPVMICKMMYQIGCSFYWSIKKWSKLDQKTFWFTLCVFFVYALLHFMSYASKFCQMKDHCKVYICGKFHLYRICGCEVKKFLTFLYLVIQYL